jgi:RibD C-terminal domain
VLTEYGVRRRRRRAPSGTEDFERVGTMVLRGVVDALHLMIYPVVVGAGKRLFAHTSETKRLRLVESKTVNDAITILVYQRAAGTGDRS